MLKAFVHENGKLDVKNIEEPNLHDDEVLVSIRTAGLNRRDVGIPTRRGKNEETLVLGSDGAGVIEKVGADVSD